MFEPYSVIGYIDQQFKLDATLRGYFGSQVYFENAPENTNYPFVVVQFPPETINQFETWKQERRRSTGHILVNLLVVQRGGSLYSIQPGLNRLNDFLVGRKNIIIDDVRIVQINHLSNLYYKNVDRGVEFTYAGSNFEFYLHSA